MSDKNPPTPDQVLLSILTRARDLERRVTRALLSPDQSDSQSKAFTLVSRLLKNSVIRPLREALGQLRPTHEPELSASTESDPEAADSTPGLSSVGLGDDLWALAKNAKQPSPVQGWT